MPKSPSGNRLARLFITIGLFFSIASASMISAEGDVDQTRAVVQRQSPGSPSNFHTVSRTTKPTLVGLVTMGDMGWFWNPKGTPKNRNRSLSGVLPPSIGMRQDGLLPGRD